MRIIAIIAATALAAFAAVGARAQTPETPEPLAQAFATYAAFQADIDTLTHGFARTADVEAALDRIAMYNSEELTRGFVAYAALAAADTPAFAAESRKVLAAYGPDVAMKGFASNGAYALSLSGAQEAQRRALAAAHFDGQRLDVMGQSLRAQALDLQAAPWARARVTDTRAERLARLRALFAEPASVSARFATPARMTLLAWTAQGPQEDARPMPQNLVSPAEQAGVMESIMSLAALRAIGKIDAMPQEDLNRLMQPRDLNACFERARLQFIQCVSAGEFWHENVACIGEAGLQTRAGCMSAIANGR